MRRRQFAAFSLLFIFAVLTLIRIRSSKPGPSLPPFRKPSITSSEEPAHFPHDASPDSHPALQLLDLARKETEAMLKHQSKTIEDAVSEYRRRYGIHPPPNFDKWYSLAREKNVQLLDEYDSIHHALRPYWGLPPAVLRARVREALGFDNALMGFAIREGKIGYAGRPHDYKDRAAWQQEATEGMIKGFVQHLPDMDLAFNLHDEPRVIVPNDDLTRLVDRAETEALAAAAGATSPRATWSNRPDDMHDGTSPFPEVRVTRFNRFAHQPTWTHSRVSCPPNSAARALNDSAVDNTLPYTFSDLGLVGNATAFSDICLSPSLQASFGFFDRPNAFDVVHDLFPIFSQSKVSSFQDLLYPSPWYWAGKVPYKDGDDRPWEEKAATLYWRGSTTGGFSRDGGWRRQHRQHVVRTVNAPDVAVLVYTNGTTPGAAPALVEAPRSNFRALFDVRFSGVGQCDPGDCDAQKEFFEIAPSAHEADAWKHKYLLDMDGNAYSGRFYAFLRSRSQVFKMAVFREWHADWLRPWLHYVPLSLKGGEWVELLRFFDREEAGKEAARTMAEAGRDWAQKVLRNEDFEVWFFRLLLEYGRLMDDDREIIGFKP